jgi:drug/metabolite transporter (DMT)-like permease
MRAEPELHPAEQRVRTLEEELAAMRQQVAARLPDDVLGAMVEATEALEASGLPGRALQPGQCIVDFVLPDASGRAVASMALRALGALIKACAMLMGAAAGWAVAIVFVRSHRFTATALALAPWQMLAAAGLLLPLASFVEGDPPRLGVIGVGSLAYVGPIATAFAYWAVVEAGRHFRASSMSMALLATPSLGILISALTLGESVGLTLVAGVLLIGAGIWLAAADPVRAASAPSEAQ